MDPKDFAKIGIDCGVHCGNVCMWQCAHVEAFARREDEMST